MPLWMQIVIPVWMYLVLHFLFVIMINTARATEWLQAILLKRP